MMMAGSEGSDRPEDPVHVLINEQLTQQIPKALVTPPFLLQPVPTGGYTEGP